jgi:NAD(P)-dependent dehydrogenase (short-subunit alcohol dehydrogenase family)
MTRHFEGKTALITGGSRGIGLAIAHALAAEGCGLVLAGRSQPSLSSATEELAEYNVPILPMTCDVRIPMAVDSLFAVLRGHVQRLDILINNAGIAHPKLTIDQLPYVMWKEVIETNLGGTFLVTQSALPLMREGGTIVNNLSAAAKHVYTGSAAYVASKHGALGLTNTLREELRPRGIRVIALLPGPTDTEIWETFWADAPRKKMMTSEAVAKAVVEVLKLSPESTVEELTMMPTSGPL